MKRIGQYISLIPRAYRLPLALALGLHLSIAVGLLVQLPGKQFRMPGPSAAPKIIKAQAVDARQVAAQVAAIKQRETQQHRQAEAKLKQLQAKVQVAKRARVQEQQRLIKLQAQQKRMAKLRAARLIKQKALARKKRIAKRQALISQRKQALEVKQKALTQAIMKQQLANEQAQLSAAQAQLSHGEIDRYKAKILRAIAQRWAIPPGVNKHLSSQFLIQLAPGGVVLSVELVKSSGNAALDRSAKIAILKASPLPVPQDPALFDKFRELKLTVRPLQVING